MSQYQLFSYSDIGGGGSGGGGGGDTCIDIDCGRTHTAYTIG